MNIPDNHVMLTIEEAEHLCALAISTESRSPDEHFTLIDFARLLDQNAGDMRFGEWGIREEEAAAHLEIEGREEEWTPEHLARTKYAPAT